MARRSQSKTIRRTWWRMKQDNFGQQLLDELQEALDNQRIRNSELKASIANGALTRKQLQERLITIIGREVEAL